MRFEITVSVFCVILTNICQSAPFENGISTQPKIMKYLFVAQKYKKFLHSPMPHEVVISTRSFITENVKRVDPIGVVIRKCDETVGLEFDKRWCYHTGSVKVNLQVKVWDPHPKIITIVAEEHTECTCVRQK